MTDYSKMSDEELMGLLGEAPAQSAAPPDYSKMSDDELYSLLGEKPEAPKTRGIGGALARGTENALLNLGALVSEVGKQTGYGGKVAPKVLASIAEMLHDPNYVSGAEDITAKDASLGDRASGLGRALVEGAPTLAVGALGGAPGLAAAAGTLGLGDAIRRVRAADQVPEDQALGGGQLARVGASGLVDAAGTFIPAGKALAPLKGAAAASTLPKALAQIGATTLKDSAKVAGVSAASSVAQAAAQKALLEKQMASPEELAAAGLVGGAAAGGARALRAVPLMGEEVSSGYARDFDPAIRANVAKKLLDSTGSYKSIKEGNAADIRQTAAKSILSDIDFEARGRRNEGPDLVARQVDALSDEGNSAPAAAYKRATDAVKAGQPVAKDDLKVLGEVVGGTDWFNRLQEATMLGELGDIGESRGKAQMGGLHASKVGQVADRMATYFGIGSMGLQAAELANANPLRHIGLPIGLAAAGVSAGLRGVDALTGQSNPIGRFARRYSDPSLVPQGTEVSGKTSDARLALRTAKMAQGFDLARQRKAETQAKADVKAQAAEAAAAKRALDAQLKDEKYRLGVMERSAEASASDAGLALRSAKLANSLEADAKRALDAQLKDEKYRLSVMDRSAEASASDAGLALRSAKLANSLEADAKRALDAQLKDEKYRLGVMDRSAEASASSAALPLRVSKLKAQAEAASSGPAQAIRNTVEGKTNGVPPGTADSPLRPPIDEAIAGSVEFLEPPKGSKSNAGQAGGKPAPETRTFGRGNYKVTLNPDKFPEGKAPSTPEAVEAWFNRANGKIMRRETFADMAAEAAGVTQKEADALVSRLQKPGMSLETAKAAFNDWVDNLEMNPANRKIVKELFNKRNIGLNSRKHWNST